MCLIFSENSTILDKFNYEIKQNELYSEDSKTIDALIHEMATRKISRVGKLMLSCFSHEIAAFLSHLQLKCCTPHHLSLVLYRLLFAEDKIGGTQIKMTMHFDNGDLAVAKPMRSVHCS